MQARQAGQRRRPGKRRSRPHRPAGKPAANKQNAAKKRVVRPKARTTAPIRAALLRGRRSFALASLGLLLMVASCATPRVGESPSHSLALVATDFDSLPGWHKDRVSE